MASSHRSDPDQMDHLKQTIIYMKAACALSRHPFTVRVDTLIQVQEQSSIVTACLRMMLGNSSTRDSASISLGGGDEGVDDDIGLYNPHPHPKGSAVDGQL